ncbi:DUF3331 domain-containing protein [Paraburkholderia sp. CNPSo 3157]|uniref:DUF3331 domain-containing protein n=1 Tax=Paraburkholderia franconis TaxID=2654983 RepID=A0A7X1NI61_9BURK|nr:DUF3331 domain-containing protein [Paraburkholderia franconis]MPW21968.1 DUF3331 domain-containing protein [Paraburkholderia franconis]
MACRNEDNIVRRALIALLAPKPFVSEATANTYIRKKKYRRSGRAATTTCEPVVVEPVPARFSIVERLSSETVSVSWSDATLGRYSGQTWRLGRARMDSYCLLTGRRIRSGDKVFRPLTQQGNLSPEYNRMILACVVNDLCCAGVSARQALGAA